MPRKNNWRTRLKISKMPTMLEMSLISLLFVGACSASSGGGSFCSIAKPIYVSPLDTEETIRQVLEHDAVYEELCE